ncbi:MAG: helix-turn-helix transcriptional regulator [Fimbriimonadaceae bacterium]|nr:helix-turn-helix transcriptional regulator [Fimbriimonadaceae bacterium]
MAQELDPLEPPPENGQGLRAPLLDHAPPFEGAARLRPWRGARGYRLPFVSNRAAPREFVVTLGHDQRSLYLAVAGPLQAESHDTYLAVTTECLLDLEKPGYEFDRELIIGTAGPCGWDGYNYFHHKFEHLAEPTAPIRAAWGTSAGVEFRLAVPLNHTYVRPGGRLALRLQAGEDGRGYFGWPDWREHHRSRANVTLEGHWSVAPAEHPFGLTLRERQVLQALADGGSAEAVAAQLALSRRTVERHLENIRQKMRRPSSLACVVEALRYGVVS